MKKHKKTLGIVLILLLFGIGYLKRDTIKGWLGISSTATLPNGNSTNTGTNSSTTTNSRSQVLKRGDSGAAVKELQRLLNQHHKANRNHIQLIPYELLIEDGIFGSKTEALLNHYTKMKSISVNQLASKLALKTA
jgi:peptidoglycan hydrolase-like protein with peptidoglycan-binding domain